MSKITISQQDLVAAFEGIECPRTVRKWFWYQWRKEKLDDVVEPFIPNTEPLDIIKGIRTLITEHAKIHRKATKVNLGDFERKSSNNTLYKKLVQKLHSDEVESAEAADPTRKYGIKSHVAIPTLFSGSLIKLEKGEENGNGKVKKPQQMALFSEEQQKNGIEITEPELPSHLIGKRAIRYIEKVSALWQKVAEEMQYDLFPAHNSNYLELLRFLKPIFNGHFAEIEEMGKINKEHGYLTFVTFLSWATALAHYKELGSMILFTEVGVTKFRDNVGLGRIDALVVRSINGESPTKKQKQLLERLSKRQFKSVGDAIVVLVQAFGLGLELTIIDWKFAVGDGTGSMRKGLNIIKADSAKDEPLQKHKNQMERYISAAYVSYALSAYTRLQKPERIWTDTHFSISGEIHYFFPDRTPVVHKIELTPQERKEVFRREVVENYTNAKYNAEIRTIEKEMLTLANMKAEEGELIVQRPAAQLAFDVPKGSVNGVSEVIYSLRERKFVDPYLIIEHMGNDKDGFPIYLMWLDRLIEEGLKGSAEVYIPGGVLSMEKTNLIPCFVHQDKTPSMAISPHKNVFKCFGCGISGHFHPDSISEHMEIKILENTKRFQKRAFGETKKIVLPERHRLFMEAAQRYMSHMLFDSPAWNYLRDVRGLIPELSQKHGAGYGEESLIDYLLDNDFLYEEMIQYGLLRFSARTKSESSLVLQLKRRGLSDEDIRREVEDKEDGKIVKKWGYPMLILNNRVTYPLDIYGQITSFYGRSIDPHCKKEFFHQKTICKDIPQGGYNLTRAMEEAQRLVKNQGDVPEILITEGPIDVDTFNQQTNFRHAGGTVGLDNKLLWEILSLFNGNIITAYDFDPSKKDVNGIEKGMSGQRATQNFVKFMKSVDFRYNIYDFTQPYGADNPGYKDMNGHWVEMWNAWKDHKVNFFAPDVQKYKYRLRLYPEQK